MKGLAAFLAASVLAAFGGSATTTPVIVPQNCVNISKVLQAGSRGEEVKKLQQFLGVEASGYFGPLTRQKLTDWQIAKKIIVSAKSAGAGTTGPKTRAVLKCSSPLSSPTPNSASTPTSTPVAKAAATTTAAKSTLPVEIAPVAFPSGGGGGGGGGVSVPSVSPYGYTCAALGEQPQTACTEGSWSVSFDEAGCIIWACMVADERG